MSKRLDQQREAKLQPERINKALVALDKAGILEFDVNDTTIKFEYKGQTVTYYPYSGWAAGKSIKDGRGLQNLLNQLK